MTLQVWFAKAADHASTNQRLLKWAADTGNPLVAAHVVKLACLRPIADAPTREATLTLARRAVELGHGNKDFSPLGQMILGMAEYRSGHYLAADEALATAANEALTTPANEAWATAAHESRATAAKISGGGPVHDTASLYRAMSLFQQGKQAEARALFTATEAKMNPLPADEKNPLADGKSDHNDLILWLAFKEARALLDAPPGKSR